MQVKRFFAFCVVAIHFIGIGFAADKPAAIASAHPLATYAGFEILDQGGNAFDAAVAVAAALAVVEPASSGLGGGGFWLLHRNKDGFETLIDSREKAPLAAKPDMFLASGHVNAERSKYGGLAAGIPGLPAALVHLAKHYGKLPLADSLKPAIRYAQQGFMPGDRHRRLLNEALPALKNDAEAARIFLDHQQIPAAAQVLRQPELATTLQKIAEAGQGGFYRGEVADKLVKSVNAHGGIWTQQDLADYQVVERQPLRGDYHGIRVTTVAPPSAGGVALLESLNILSAYPLASLNRVQQTHLFAEALRRSFHDRALYLGDPDFISIPIARLISPDYAAGLRSTIRADKALPSALLSNNGDSKIDGQNTTHLSIIDGEGNRVAATLSINFPFGAGFVAEGTGVVLNDEMDDFASQPGSANGYGLVGSAANSIQPGKRMLSSMTPTFLEDETRIAVLGTPGGSRIPTMVLLAVLDFAEGHAPESWVKKPRVHHQYLPDVLSYEPDAFSHQEIADLTALGHRLEAVAYPYGDMQAVEFNKSIGKLRAASDPRGEGLALVR